MSKPKTEGPSDAVRRREGQPLYAIGRVRGETEPPPLPEAHALTAQEQERRDDLNAPWNRIDRQGHAGGYSEASDRSDERYLAEVEARQAAYLTASGTLTQFNAILAAIHSSALAWVDLGALKAALAVALVLHIISALSLFWAAKPVVQRRAASRILAIADHSVLVDHTFRNYQRGWHLTLVALLASSAVAALFAVHAFGVAFPDITSLIRR